MHRPSPLWPDRRQKPEPGSVRINSQHPFALGLKGYWMFNQGGGPPINLVTGRQGSFVDKPVWVGGLWGRSLSIDGVDDYVDTGEAMNAGSAGNYSIGLVFKGSSTAQGVLMGQYDNTGPGSNLMLWGLSGSSNITIYTEGQSLTSTSNVFDGLWHHATAVYERVTNGYRFYIDRVNEAASDGSGLVAPDVVTTTMKFGFGTALGFKAATFALGYFYDRPLTFSEVCLLHTQPYNMLELVKRRVVTPPAAATFGFPFPSPQPMPAALLVR